MKSVPSSVNLIKSFLRFSLILTLILRIDSQSLNALSMDNYQNKIITEELRLEVPKQYKDIWLKAEIEVWEPWLKKQKGFLNRQVFYNQEKGEALLLVNWENKKLWKEISVEEVESIQLLFEEKIKNFIDEETNPFKLIYSGELHKQK